MQKTFKSFSHKPFLSSLLDLNRFVFKPQLSLYLLCLVTLRFVVLAGKLLWHDAGLSSVIRGVE